MTRTGSTTPEAAPAAYGDRLRAAMTAHGPFCVGIDPHPALLAAWLIGFAVYQWLRPTGPCWWVDAVESVRPPTGGLDAIGVSIPSFLAAFALAAAAAGLSRRARLSRT